MTQTLGASLAVGLWAVASAAFAFCVANFSSYGVLPPRDEPKT